MDRREFVLSAAAMPFVKFGLEPLLPEEGVQELVLPDDLALAFKRHCRLPLEERVVSSDEAAKIALALENNGEAVFVHATYDREKYDYAIFSWFNTGKRNKQYEIAKHIAAAGEFVITKKNGFFVMQTNKCKVPSFRTSDRRMVVDYDDDDWWPYFGAGTPAYIKGNQLFLSKRDFFILMQEVFDPWAMIDYFDDDLLKGDVACKLADRLRQPDVDPNPWPGMAGWKPIADWLSQGECLFVPFPNQPMV